MFKLIFLLLIAVSFKLFAYDLVVHNQTGKLLRIDILEDQCKNVLVSQEAPVIIEPDAEIIFTNVHPVKHFYKMCAVGNCILTTFAFDTNLNIETYSLKAFLDKYSMLYVKADPDIWPGTEASCQ